MPWSPALWRQRLIDLHEFKVSLIYIVSPQVRWGHAVRPCLKLVNQLLKKKPVTTQTSTVSRRKLGVTLSGDPPRWSHLGGAGWRWVIQ